MTIRNINERWGMAVTFEGVEEMEAAIRASGYPLLKGGLVEGIDYEEVATAESPALDSAYSKLQAAGLEVAVQGYMATKMMEQARARAQLNGLHAIAGDAEWYQAEASRTSAGPDGVAARLAAVAPLLHAAVGLATEAGELLDALKKHVWYNAPFDRTNCVEEVGDVAWYLAEACTALDVPMREVFVRNISKLRRRYSSGGFTAAAAQTRDLAAERTALEEGSDDK